MGNNKQWIELQRLGVRFGQASQMKDTHCCHKIIVSYIYKHLPVNEYFIVQLSTRGWTLARSKILLTNQKAIKTLNYAYNIVWLSRRGLTSANSLTMLQKQYRKPHFTSHEPINKLDRLIYKFFIHVWQWIKPIKMSKRHRVISRCTTNTHYKPEKSTWVKCI